MKRFWSYHGWEFLLCLAAAVPLVLSFSQGFYIPDGVADSVPLAALVCGAALLYGFLGSFRRRTAVCFSLGFVGIAGGFFLWMGQMGIDIVDQEGSGTAVYIYVIAAPVIALLVFLLSRSRLGIVILFLTGACLHAVTAFLGYESRVWWTALFSAASAALFLLRSYRVSALKTDTVTPQFGRFFALSAAVGGAGAVLALVLWGAVIRPLDPPTVDLALLTRYMRYEVLEMVGISRQYPVPGGWYEESRPDQTVPSGGEDSREDETPKEQAPDGAGAGVPKGTQSDFSQLQETGSVTYEGDMTGVLAGGLAAAVLAALAVPAVRQAMRRRRMALLTRGEPREQVVNLYRFYLSRFARLGCPRLPAQTEREYAARYHKQLAPYTAGGMDVERMTALYLDARYGGLPVSDGDCRALAELYPVLLRNCRALAGNVRYVMYYFVL